MTRKLLSLLVAVAFILTTVSTAFAAAVPSDVTGTDYVKAVTKMQGLGIMVGDPTGNFRPNDTIKRSEFAKIAVIALGMGDAAAISAGTTQFSDVPADSWASGYINVAAGAGVIKGYAGKFNPDATLTYAEAVTIITRMLGYGPVLDTKPWPQAYVAKAAEIGVTDGVTMATTVGAKRGDVAKLVNNALTIKPLKVTGYNENALPTYGIGVAADTLLVKNLGCTSVAGHGDNSDLLLVTNTPSFRTDDSTVKAALDGVDKEFSSNLNPDDYIGLEIKAWTKKFDGVDRVVAVEVATAPANYYDGTISKDDPAKIKLDTLSKVLENQFANDMDTAHGAKVILNGKDLTTPTTSITAFRAAIDTNKAVGRVVFDGVKLKGIYAWTQSKLSDPDANSNTFVLRKINAESKFEGQKSLNGTTISAGFVDNLKVQDYKDKITNKSARVEVIKNGSVATIDDIKVGDVVTKINLGGAGSHYKFIVTSNEVKGTINSISGTDAGMKLKIADKDYTLASGATFTYNNDVYDKYYNNVSSIVGKEVTVKLNAAGQIFGLITTAPLNTFYYGVYKEGYGGTGAYATIYKADGTKVSYSLEDTNDITGNWSGTTNGGKLTQYQLTSDGKIKDGSLKLASDPLQTDLTYAVNASAVATPSASTVTIGSSIYAFDSSSVIFDVTDATDVKAISFDTIKDKGFNTNAVKVLVDGLKVKYAAVTGSNLSTAIKGIVVARGFDGDGKILKVNVEGTVKTYKVDTGYETTVDSTYPSDTYTEFKVNSSGKVYQAPDAVLSYNYTTTTYGQLFRVTSIDSDTIFVKPVTITVADGVTVVNNEGFFKLDDKVKTYDATNNDDSETTIKGGLAVSSIAADDLVWVDQQVADYGSANEVTVIVKVNRDDVVGP